MRNYNITTKKDCPVCPRKDKEWIETLMAAGANYDDLRVEFGIRVIDLRRHEALHSTKQPSVDPTTLLREMRWLNEQATKLVRRELGAEAKPNTAEVVRRRLSAINTSLKVLSAYSELINAPKHLESHVVLPMWHQTVMKLGEKLKDIPGATEALIEWAKEEGPSNTGVQVKTREIEKLIENEQQSPSVQKRDHWQHQCPTCKRRMRCYDPTCTDTVEMCRKCVLLEKEKALAEAETTGLA